MIYSKVIVVSGHLGRIHRAFVPYPHHPQHISSMYDLEKMWSKNFEVETTVDGGVCFDTIIVCNDEVSYAWWSKFDNEKTKNGKFVIFQRENFGGSFGGYSYAYQNTDYDGFLFTEEDLIIFGENYYRRIVDRFNEVENAGYVGLIGAGEDKRYTSHCHGGVGYTTRTVLDSVKDVNGELPYHHAEWDQTQVIIQGEVPFTQNILNKGFELIGLNEHKYEWSKDNLVYPYVLL